VAYLLRAAGKLKQARDAAEIAKDAVLLRGLSIELEDWDSVIKQHQVINSDSPFNRGRETESLCYLAVYQFLAGRESEVDALLKKLIERFDEKTDDAWQTGETLLLCERFDLALDFLKKWRPLAAIELLRHRQQPAEVFAWLKTSPDQEFTRAWFDELPTQPNTRITWPEARFSLACQLAQLLHFCGRRDDAARLFALLEKLAEEFATASEQRSFGLLAESENGAGQGTVADKHLARALTVPNNVYHLSRVLPKPQGAAAWWWGQLRRRTPGEAPTTSLQTLRKLLTPGKMPPDQWAALRDEMELYVATLLAAEQGKATMFLAETALLQNDVQGARTLLERAAAEYEPAALKLADLLARDKTWEAAAKWYQAAAGPAADALGADPKPDPLEEGKPRAVAPGGAAPAKEVQPAQLLALYLYGFARAESGDPEAGEGIMTKAQQRLATAASRHQFALGLQERGLKKQALEQWQIIRRSGPLNSWHTNTAAEHLGNLISGEQPLAAARLWRMLTLQLASTNSSLLDMRGYIDLPVTIHRTRAKAFLAEGKTDAALAELALADKAYPAQTKLVEDFVPLLEKAGLKAEAEKMFNAAYAQQAKLCADFPAGASYLNNLAWLSARCRRKLDEALSYSTKAVELAPENAGYLDTLAEVHYQRGEKEKAIELMKRCLELEPRRAYFQKQLQRFQTDAGEVPEE
jgi:tetratricopeptide (TPR) repeat protein